MRRFWFRHLQSGFEVLTAVDMKSTIVWDITLCSPVKVNWRFGETFPPSWGSNTPWRWMRYVCPKRRLTFNIFQKISTFLDIARPHPIPPLFFPPFQISFCKHSSSLNLRHSYSSMIKCGWISEKCERERERETRLVFMHERAWPCHCVSLQTRTSVSTLYWPLSCFENASLCASWSL
jgi:hypothetical protein